MVQASWRARFWRIRTSLLTRMIPSSGEPVPAVGLGTASIFDTPTTQRAAKRQP